MTPRKDPETSKWQQADQRWMCLKKPEREAEVLAPLLQQCSREPIMTSNCHVAGTLVLCSQSQGCIVFPAKNLSRTITLMPSFNTSPKIKNPYLASVDSLKKELLFQNAFSLFSSQEPLGCRLLVM